MTFRKADDEQDGIVKSFGNMSPGFEFDLNGVYGILESKIIPVPSVIHHTFLFSIIVWREAYHKVSPFFLHKIQKNAKNLKNP